VRWLAVFLLMACKPDAPAPGPAPAASSAIPLDTSQLTLASIAGWWIVEAGFKPPADEPGRQPGHAWYFTPDTLRLVFGDASDKRRIEKSVVEIESLQIVTEGATLRIMRRPNGLFVQSTDDDVRVPLRRATQPEIAAIEAADKKRNKMIGRACEKALECCLAARDKQIAKPNDCDPLMTSIPDMQTCIQAIVVFKNKMNVAKVVLPECLPDK
jgi:hypothetical protein